MLELYHYGDSLCSMKTRFCLLEKGVEYESHFVDLLQWEHLTEEYKKLNPNSVVPTIVHDGMPIIESTIINQYIDEVFDGPSLTPEDPGERARMRILIKLQDDVIHPAIQKPTFNLLMKPLLAKKSDDELDEWLSTHPLEKSRKLFKGAARGPVNDEALEDARNQFNFVFERMDQALANGDWLCGNQFSLADIAFAPALDRLGQCDWLDLFDGYPRVMKWCGRIREREAYAKMRPQDAQRLSNLV
ncbi:MAG: glutathione S-transferase family protein [Rhodospirillales bacterium]